MMDPDTYRRLERDRKIRAIAQNRILQADLDKEAAQEQKRKDSAHRPPPTFKQLLKAIHRVPVSPTDLKELYGQPVPSLSDDEDLTLPTFSESLLQLCERPCYKHPRTPLSEEAIKLKEFLIYLLESDYRSTTTFPSSNDQTPFFDQWDYLALLIRDSKLSYHKLSLPSDQLLQMSKILQEEVWKPAMVLGLSVEEVEESLLAYRKWKGRGCFYAVQEQNGRGAVTAKLWYDWFLCKAVVEPGVRREKVLEGIREMARGVVEEGSGEGLVGMMKL